MAVDSLLHILIASRAKELRSSLRRTLDELAVLPIRFPLGERLGGDQGALAQLTPWFFEWLEHDQNDEYWKELSVGEILERQSGGAPHYELV